MWNTFQSLPSDKRYATQVPKMYEKMIIHKHPKTSVIGRVILEVKSMKTTSTETSRRQQKKNVIVGLKNLDSRLRTSEDFREKMRNIDERIFTGK